MPIKNIIFDLGGVLLNIDYNKTINAFIELGIQNFDEMYSQSTANQLFEDLETGKISENDFYAELKKVLPANINNNDIQAAWNKMLLNFRIESLNSLNSLKENYKIFLLSNTNSIHISAFNQIFFKETGKKRLDDFFHKAYYSNIIGLRKPHKEAFEYVLNDAGIQASDTLFIDDSINNITTAKSLNLMVHHLLPNEYIEQLKLN
ncbi:MAG: HAD family phosphatase [Chitinophagaceae bacterium]|nr:HAD family phosphatase [Chitinophagaceae bacterium]